MNTVLVTGAAGQVGCRVVRQLLGRNYHVRAAVLPDDPALSRLEGLDVEVCPVNLLDTTALAPLLDRVQGIVHTANLVSPLPGMSETDMFDNNVRATFNVTAAAAEKADDLERLVVLSSSSVYPNDSHSLACAYHPVDESHPKRPEPLYPLSKWLGEEIVRAFARATGLRTALVRPSGIVSGDAILSRWTADFAAVVLEIGLTSPRSEMFLPDAGEPWHDLRARAHTPEQPCAVTDPSGRPWVYQPVDARDVAHGAICALEHPAAVGEAFNLAAPEPISFPAAAALLAEATGQEILEYAAPVRWVYDLDIARARSWIGYAPRWGLAEMIADALAVRAGENDGMS